MNRLVIFTLLSVNILLSCNAQQYQQNQQSQQQQQQYKSVSDLPFDVYRFKLDGLVTSVHEGDNFMFYHVPSNTVNVGRVNYRDTMIVRLVGIDSPEVSRPGVPGEPFSQHARDRLARLVLNKRITVELFGRKGIDEVWGSVNIDGENVSVKMVEEGLAKVLIDRNAVYGDVRSQLFKAETRAKYQRLGIWAL